MLYKLTTNVIQLGYNPRHGDALLNIAWLLIIDSKQLVALFFFKLFLNIHQYVFLSGRSTNLSLLGYEEDILEIFGKNKVNHDIYTDFFKAFDAVDHDVPIHMMEHVTICGPFFRWCDFYLHNKSGLVMVCGFKSVSKAIFFRCA